MEINDASIGLDKVYEAKGDFLIIGLTGRTGSGCSTSAKILTSKNLKVDFYDEGTWHHNDKSKLQILNSYLVENWSPFIWLQMKSILMKFVLEMDFQSFKQHFELIVAGKIDGETLGFDIYTKLEEEYEKYHQKVIGISKLTDEEKKESFEEIYNLYINEIPTFCEIFRECLKKVNDSYIKYLQAVGDNIRASGKANDDVFDPDKVFFLIKHTNKIIISIRNYCKDIKRPCRVVIDAIRSPYESIFLRERYSSFYLVSVNIENQYRLEHLEKSHKFSKAEIDRLDKKEYPSRLRDEKQFTSQNIQKCIELADIHIKNSNEGNAGEIDGHPNLVNQWVWYVALMLHPGMVMPTSQERCMQLAYTAKLNSGCISRQVGAVVADENWSVKSIGWNTTPQGQVPCNLRSYEDLNSAKVGSKTYSNYEVSDELFRETVKKKFEDVKVNELRKGRNVSYCFKDVQNEIEGEKNQVHTRSLHAEENAFLQITKYGGQKIQGGILFTTASPCELCSKKAYQLGIKTIYYIDPYPGIANDHILACGKSSPDMNLFFGAIGHAYHRLYEPYMAYKDELQVIFSLKSNSADLVKSKGLEEENERLKDENEKLKKALGV